ncbi:Uncharacterised protein [Acinetobacter baumannii]|nr:Uncharacterised protein [Acinetobacter baumannii]
MLFAVRGGGRADGEVAGGGHHHITGGSHLRRLRDDVTSGADGHRLAAERGAHHQAVPGRVVSGGGLARQQALLPARGFLLPAVVLLRRQQVHVARSGNADAAVGAADLRGSEVGIAPGHQRDVTAGLQRSAVHGLVHALRGLREALATALLLAGVGGGFGLQVEIAPGHHGQAVAGLQLRGLQVHVLPGLHAQRATGLDAAGVEGFARVAVAAPAALFGGGQCVEVDVVAGRGMDAAAGLGGHCRQVQIVAGVQRQAAAHVQRGATQASITLHLRGEIEVAAGLQRRVAAGTGLRTDQCQVTSGFQRQAAAAADAGHVDAADTLQVTAGHQGHVTALDQAAVVEDVLHGGDAGIAARGNATAIVEQAAGIDGQSIIGADHALVGHIAGADLHRLASDGGAPQLQAVGGGLGQVHHRHQHLLAVHFLGDHPHDVFVERGHLFGRQRHAHAQLLARGFGHAGIHHGAVLAHAIALVGIQVATPGQAGDLFHHQALLVEVVTHPTQLLVRVQVQALEHVVRADPLPEIGEARIGFHQPALVARIDRVQAATGQRQARQRILRAAHHLRRRHRGDTARARGAGITGRARTLRLRAGRPGGHALLCTRYASIAADRAGALLLAQFGCVGVVALPTGNVQRCATAVRGDHGVVDLARFDLHLAAGGDAGIAAGQRDLLGDRAGAQRAAAAIDLEVAAAGARAVGVVDGRRTLDHLVAGQRLVVDHAGPVIGVFAVG